MAKRTNIVGSLVWSHHPRGGFITGYAGPVESGLYSPERGIAISAEAAKKGEFFTHVPSTQIYPGLPPEKKE